MPAARGFLERLRTCGTPGAAAGAGVPADRVAEREAELAGLFSQLERTEAEAAAIRAAGRRDADAVRADADARCRTLLARADHEAETQRREAAARVAAVADAETAAALAAAAEEADRVRAHAERVRAELVATVLAAVRTELGLPGTGAP